MAKRHRNNHFLRGFIQSEDGVISRVLEINSRSMTFEATFEISEQLADRLKNQPEHILFSERSRIARLGVQIKCAPPTADNLQNNIVSLTLSASSMIPGYPDLGQLKVFFTLGLPVGRLVFCDPDALLSSDEVLAAIERSN